MLSERWMGRFSALLRRCGRNLLAAAAGTFVALSSASVWALSVDDIEAMARQGLSEEVLLQVVRSANEVPVMSKDDYTRLMNAGVTNNVLKEMALRSNARVYSPVSDMPVRQQDAGPARSPAALGDEQVLAPVETSNLPIILRKFFEEAYEAFEVQAEVSRRYAELQSAAAGERANDAELPRIASYRAMAATNPRASLGACLSLMSDAKPAASSLAAAALNQCIGEALYALGMYAMSAAYLDLALQSPSPIEDYSPTFMKFLDAAHRTEYLSGNPFPIRARANVIEKEAQSSFLYFVGYSFVHGSRPDFDMARKTLKKIARGDLNYVRAQILVASLDLRPPEYRFKSAAEALRNAIEAVGELRGDEARRLENLAWLTLGRIAYENHAYEESDAFYRKVDVTSHQFTEAVLENAWGRLYAGHPEETLGLTHALRAPRFADRWLPDVLILEAAAYLKLCRYDQAAASVDVLKKRYIAMSAEMARFAASVPQRDYYNQVMIYAQNGEGSLLPGMLFSRIISDYGFYSLHTSLNTLTRERRTLREQVGGGLSGIEMLEKAYDEAIGARQQVMGVKIAGIIESARSQLHSLDITSSQMMIDIRLARRAREAACLKAVAEGKECVQEGAADGNVGYYKGDGDAFWEFSGEFWRDEMLSYVPGIGSLCPQ